MKKISTVTKELLLSRLHEVNKEIIEAKKHRDMLRMRRFRINKAIEALREAEFICN